LGQPSKDVLYRLTTEMGNVEVARMRIVLPAPRPRAKRTLNVLYRLTTEMGKGRGCKNSPACPPAARTRLSTLV